MPLPKVPDVTGIPEKKRGFSLRLLEWLFSPDHFHFKLLFGTAVGVLVIILLAVGCVVVTSRNQQKERLRAHTIEVMRLSSVIENDIAALENTYRGYLLTRDQAYVENFGRQQSLFLRHNDDLNSVLGENSRQRERVLKIREIAQSWFKSSSLEIFSDRTMSAVQSSAALTAPAANEIREILHAVQKEEQIDLNRRVREQEWAIQSTQILHSIPKMQRAASDMQKELRGYLLTGDPAFTESYKRATADFYTYHGYLSVLVGSEHTELAQLNRIREQVEIWITQCAIPYLADQRNAADLSDAAQAGRSESLMNNVRRAMEHFEKNQVEVYNVRSKAATRERILTATAIDFFCALAAILMIASSSYSFVLCRRQLKKLAGADAQIRSVVDHVLDGMITIDEQGAIYSMNPAAKRMFGYNANEFFGDDFMRLIPKYFEQENDSSPVATVWEQLAERIGRTTFALAQTRGRATFPAELSLTKMNVEQRTYYVAMVRDVTERRRFEEELAAEKESLAVTLASIGDGVITTDLNGKIAVCNAAGEAMTGWKANEAVGQPMRTVLAISAEAGAKRKPSGAGCRSEAERILLKTPERATLTSRDGVERLIELATSPIRNGKNDVSGVVLVFRDITERQRDEEERRKAEALDQLGLLAGGIAHDFNNLLTAIIGNISLASLLLPRGDKLVERLDDAKNASMRARDLAQQLLTFARGGAPIKQTASISDLVQETVSFSLRGSQSRSELKIEPDLWTAQFDLGQISQVIANLVVNADQAMPEGGTLYVGCENFTYREETTSAVPDLKPGDYIRIQLRDEGVGIPESCLKQIFDPYFTTKPKGNGLGLATTYSVLKNHDGLITVASEQHCGATFTVYLPAGRGEPVAAAEPAAAPADEPVATGTGRVLIVDDEEAIRMLVDFTLSRLGYEVVTAETAVRGIELYREGLEQGERFDLVILDLTLPGGMGGKDALRRLIEIDPMVNAVVSSGYAMDATMSRYEDFGFRGVIAKPYEASELGRKVNAVIKESRNSYASAYELQRAC